MNAYVAAYISMALIFCLMDYIWLTKLAKNFYQLHMGDLMLSEPKLIAAAGFYVLYLAGLLVFAVIPGIRANNVWIAIGFGALLGLIAYASYDLTNLSTLKGWSYPLTLVDISWGIFVSATASAIGYLAAQFALKG